MLKSFKTTTAGIIAAIAITINVVSLFLDGDPTTNPDWNIVIPELLVALGLVSARDNDVSSEEAGAK